MAKCGYCFRDGDKRREFLCDKHLAYFKEMTVNKRKTGTCYDCNEPAEPGHRRCAKHIKHDQDRAKRWRRGNGRFITVQKQAERRGHKWALTEEQFLGLNSADCCYCGLPNTTVVGSGLDRVDPKGDYTIENVVSCCADCNRMKFNIFTLEEMLIIGKAIREVKLARMNK
jgi:hypothetical protein